MRNRTPAPGRYNHCMFGDDHGDALSSQVNRHQPDDPDPLEFRTEDSHLVTEPVRETYTLDDLLAGITEENLHDETEWGPPVGAEAW